MRRCTATRRYNQIFLPRTVRKHRQFCAGQCSWLARQRVRVRSERQSKIIIHNLRAKGNSGVKMFFAGGACLRRPRKIFPSKILFALASHGQNHYNKFVSASFRAGRGRRLPGQLFPSAKWRRVTGVTWRIGKWAAPRGPHRAACRGPRERPPRAAKRSIDYTKEGSHRV